MIDEANPYSILGVRPGATKDEITARYRELSKKWHPDVCKDPRAGEMMKLVNQAFDRLTKPQPAQPEPEPTVVVVRVRSWYWHVASTATTADDSSTFGGFW